MLLKRISFSCVCVWVFLTATTLLVLCSHTAATNSPVNSSPGQRLPVVDDTLNSADRALINRWLRPGDYMLPQQVKPGMEGYGLSVFQGSKPERFNVKIIGVLKKLLNGRDAILARLSGASLGKNNVIRGMSGSPVYINGKLIGAISYGFDFSKEPICGITPIVDMLDALAQDTDQPVSKNPVISRLVPSHTFAASGIAQSTVATTSVSASAPHMVPLMSPIALSGFSPRAQEFLGEYLRQFGLSVDSGASGALDPSLASLPAQKGQAARNHYQKASAVLSNQKRKSSGARCGELAIPSVTSIQRSERGTQRAERLQKDQPIQPGSALAIMLSTGDFPISATGTATACFGGNVIGFGHPFLQAGCVDFPMASAYVHQVLPCISASVKVASPVKVVGSIVSDRPWSVGGQIARSSKLIPVTYTVKDETRHMKRTYRCHVVDHPDLTPELFAATAMSAIDATHQSTGPYVVKLESTIDAGELGTIHRLDRFSSNFTPRALTEAGKFRLVADPVGSFILNTSSKIIDNDFQKAEIKKADFDITLEDGHKTAFIERVYIDKSFVTPGEEVRVNCVLRPYNQGSVTKVLTLKIPRDVPDGNLVLGVSSGDEIDQLRKRMGLVDPVSQNIKQVIQRILSNGRGDAITAVVALPEQSVIIDGVCLTNPPSHWHKLFFSNRYTAGPSLVKGEIRTSLVQDWLVDGSHLLTVEVRRDDKTSAKQAPYSVSVHGSQEAHEGAFVTELAKKTLENTKKPDSTANDSSSGNSDKSTRTSQSQAAYWLTPKDYPHMRALLMWHQDSEEDFRPGKAESAAIDNWGRISPAFKDIGYRTMNPDMQVWSSVFSLGYFWFSTRDKVYRWKGDQSLPESILKLDSAFIPALAADSKGTIYAASIPQGEVIAIEPMNGGKKHPGRTVFKTSEPVITSLCIDGKSNLYVGVAGSGKVYKVDLSEPSNKSSVVFDSGQAHVVSLFYNKYDERVYVGTAEKGAVYSIDSLGKARAEYQTNDHIVTGIAKDSKGNLYVASAGQGHLVKVSPSGEVVSLAASEAFYTLIYDPSTDCAYAGDAEGDITQAQIDPVAHQAFFIPVCHTDEEAVLCLTTDDKGRLFAGTANLACVRTFEMKPSPKACYSSYVKDALRTGKWSRIRIFGAYDEVTDRASKSLAVETRTGETSQPDMSWSNWQIAFYDKDSFLIKSPPGRYLQYKLSWKLPDKGRGAAIEKNERSAERARDEASGADINKSEKPFVVGKVETTYLPNNLAPQFNNISVKSGSSISGKYDMSVAGIDGDGDNLLLSLELSSDGAKTWMPIVGNLRAKQALKSGSEQSSGLKQSTSENTKPESKDVSTDGESANSREPKQEDKRGNDNALRETTSRTRPSGVLPESTNQDHRFLEERSSSNGSLLNSSTEHGKKALDESESSDDSKKDADKVGMNRSADSNKVTKTKNKWDKKLKLSDGQDLNNTSRTTVAALTPLEKFSYVWDTTKMKDGHYIVKLTLDDKLSNPEDNAKITSFRSITIDNSPPEIVSWQCSRNNSGRYLLRILAKDLFSPIANATYRIDDGELLALSGLEEPTDGLNVVLGVKDIEVQPSTHKLEVQVTDKAGNTITKTLNIH